MSKPIGPEALSHLSVAAVHLSAALAHHHGADFHVADAPQRVAGLLAQALEGIELPTREDLAADAALRGMASALSIDATGDVNAVAQRVFDLAMQAAQARDATAAQLAGAALLQGEG